MYEGKMEQAIPPPASSKRFDEHENPWQFKITRQLPAHFYPKVIKMPKILQQHKHHGIFYCHIVSNLRDIWQINLIGLLRYGNPDVLNLANLKNKIQFHYISSIFKRSLKSNFILSHSLNFLSKNLTEMWQP